MKNHVPFKSNEIDNILDEIEKNEIKHELNGDNIIDIHLFDEVLMMDKSIGIVKFIGEIKGKDGLFFGIDIKKGGKGINNGCVKNKRYFRTKNNKNTGRFTQISKIRNSTKTPKSIPFTIGTKIQCLQLNTTAIIKYVGIPAFNKTMKTVYFGIELAEPKGDCNGEIYSSYLGKKISYFKCAPNHGLYIKATDITINYISKDSDEKQKEYGQKTEINLQLNRIKELEYLLNQKQAEIDRFKVTISKNSKQNDKNSNDKNNNDKNNNDYGWDEIILHNSAKDLWLVWYGKVYDLTRFLKFHPGGVEVILQIAEKSQDITKPLKMLNHPPIADSILLKHHIGNVKDVTQQRHSWKQMDSIWDSKNNTLSGKRMITNIMSETEALITWSDVFSVHIDILDKQHENLANLINELYKSYQLKDIVELLHRWDVHCKTEETLFHYYGFDIKLQDSHNIDHRQIYHKIKDTITGLRIKYNNNKPQCEELIGFAKAASEIFKKHHFQFDSQYVEHLDNVNNKIFE